MHLLVEELTLLLLQNNMMMVTAESCTGGMIASAITERAGSSAVFDRGFVTYSNESKIEMLGVAPSTIEKFGAVSDQCAFEMSQCALAKSNAKISVSVTGIAGPSGGSDEKPVGLVYIATAIKNGAFHVSKNIFDGDRNSIRQATLKKSLEQTIQQLGMRI